MMFTAISMIGNICNFYKQKQNSILRIVSLCILTAVHFISNVQQLIKNPMN